MIKPGLHLRLLPLPGVLLPNPAREDHLRRARPRLPRWSACCRPRLLLTANSGGRDQRGFRVTAANGRQGIIWTGCPQLHLLLLRRRDHLPLPHTHTHTHTHTHCALVVTCTGFVSMDHEHVNIVVFYCQRWATNYRKTFCPKYFFLFFSANESVSLSDRTSFSSIFQHEKKQKWLPAETKRSTLSFF